MSKIPPLQYDVVLCVMLVLRASFTMFAVVRNSLRSSAGVVGRYNPPHALSQSLSQVTLLSAHSVCGISRRTLLCRQNHPGASSRGCDHDQKKEDLLQSSLSTSMLVGNLLPFFGKLAFGAGAVSLSILALLYVRQEDMLYIPTIDVIGRDNSQNPRGYRSPSEYSVPFETHFIPSSADGVASHSWLLLHPLSKERQLPTIIFFHGNAGNVGVRIPNAVELYNHLEANVLLVEYRGYGESTPKHIKPTERGIKADAESVLDFVLGHPKIDPSKIFIFGRSLGGAVAFHVADYAERHSKPLAGILVENTFESIGHMVDVLLPFLSPFKGVLLRNKWDSTALARRLTVPVLYISGDSDEIVPRAQMEDLFSRSRGASRLSRFHSVDGGTHNETWLQGGKDYWRAINFFLVDACSKKKG